MSSVTSRLNFFSNRHTNPYIFFVYFYDYIYTHTFHNYVSSITMRMRSRTKVQHPTGHNFDSTQLLLVPLIRKLLAT